MATKTLTDVSLQVLNKRIAKESKNPVFNFAFFGDTWFDWGDATKQSFAKAKKDAIRRYQIFLSCLQEASRLKPRPLFILYGGDAVRSGTEEQIRYFRDTAVRFVKKYNIPIFLVPGNHERTGIGGPLTLYQIMIGPRKGNKVLQENELSYILNTPNLRMVMLNDIGPVSGGTVYGITPSALSVFEKGIHAKKDVVVVIHVPPKSGSFKNFPHGDVFPINTPENKKFIASLRKSPNVKLVLVSHIHNNLLKGTITGKTAVLNGNGGAGTDVQPTPKPAIATFTYNNKNKSIAFKGQKPVVVNTKQSPDKVFITTQSGTKAYPI